ncbi:MAG TPA: secondary thiamine-phosphate synthase enzyme YjbQ [Rhodothermales bacterium]|nr:secondary thiamine-phosphate synthase enzyme YjbQ [Rhodothermales bacterium]
MIWIQKHITLAPRPRGFHVVTQDVIAHLAELQQVSIGLIHLFILHTSASLSLNENVSPDVRADMERHFDALVPEGAPYYQHTLEGADDMPAHIKASLLGSGLTIPISEGRLVLGTWQGIYLCEHRNRGGRRELVATLFGERRS